MNQQSYRKKLLGPLYKAVLPEPWPSATWQAQPMVLSERITQLRLWRGMSMQAASDRVGISRQAWDKWERGVARPTPGNLPKLCKALGVTLADIAQPAGHQDAIWTSRREPCICPACLRTFEGMQANLVEIYGDIWQDVYDLKTCETPPE